MEQKLKEIFGKKLRYAGGKSPQVRKIIDIAKNKKGSAKKSFVIEGIWASRLALKHGVVIEYVLISPEHVKTKEAEGMIFELAERAGAIYIVSGKTMDAAAESGNHAGLLVVCGLSERGLDDIPLGKKALVLILDGLEIPGNVGTLVRSVDGVDATGVVITNKKTRLTHPKYIRSSQGSCFRVPVVESSFEKTARWLQDNEFDVLLADTRATSQYYELDYSGRVALVLGGERHGISREYYNLKHRMVGIPMYGDCDSLNVGIAGTVILYEASLKQKGLRS